MDFTKRQIEIIETATELIHSGGIQNVTTKNIAAKMEFTEPSIYRHFKNKSEILQSIILHFRNQMKKKMKELNPKKLKGRELLQEMLKLQFSHFHHTPAIATVIFSEGMFQNEKNLSDTIKKVVNAKKKFVLSIIEDGQSDGSIRKDMDADMIASTYIGSMRFTLLEWRLNDCSFDLEKKSEQLVESMNKWMN